VHIELAHERLNHLPSPLPPPRAEIEAHILRVGPLPPGARREHDGPVRDAAALILLYPDDRGEAHIVLMVRPSGDHIHAGQVALPGGKREAYDTFPEGTALREACEEVGLDTAAAGVTTLGVLETVDVRVSGFWMVPVLAVAEREPRFVADEREVARILTVPVRHFLPDAPIEIVEEDRDGWMLRYGAYPVAGHHVWGATGRALAQLGAVLGADEARD
jgi:8-oxo-dGTP pyrophosphatase MutT (NUDIX family)